jgi:mRNA-degrading endonuclease HigB of HigAB toxin-antitoxin module
MKPRIIVASVLLCALSARADKIDDAVKKGEVTKDFVNSLTPNDVPRKWRTTVEEITKGNRIKRVFSRGSEKVVEVGWDKDWSGDRVKLFTAVVYDGRKQLVRIARIGESTTAFGLKDAEQYQVSTSLRDGGALWVVVRGPKDYLQVIQVQGRETRLMDDLEFTRRALLVQAIPGLLLEAIDLAPDGQKADK